ncbi:squalene/phytoene synthase family protein [Anabaena cylindrica FACHB-243]|uniref:Farnesyl-diphosphate farnesyltransferase n=1 Tax=Anabaena cylindrica (strain ATCC 27899 / PCC 7122) TaxID=272123 RepID=K9ZA10_ANACC|nr:MULTISPECIES: squalene/phytoene synthase family protein [Anabaena]AFZ56043.1 farnesyl-diphosphate farnesyltransferase [Anabaena cylindrica PCC 7122]MBD2419634.1 squalene/phytoene synthase family protein [Anabaena cylindrica FACHB-243]MBY5284300.1 squalene/phytoene synthase family protein [Anabaena sp. CCAP 1446/1C]MBY5307486.1 squalene/phytoene synthase family protein [Anabaena sp. CCAP 1446/1C]MCM2408260.1 squalene/phytoene synthase family protein [Anabaena sp. CCAP 1446/1C]
MLTFYLLQEQKKYIEEYMNKVSRSFALVTPCLEEPLDAFMSIAYLIFRVADNIEDCQKPFEWQRCRFNEFKRLLKEPNVAPDILSNWSFDDWWGLNTDQKELMTLEHGLMLWKIYALVPDSVREIIARWAEAMVEGIEKILDDQQKPLMVTRNGVRILAEENDYSSYCYFAAGTVGLMGTELAIDHYQFNTDTAKGLLSHSQTCGQALQKTNIVKDFPEDLANGICYLPDVWIQEADNLPLLLKGAPKKWTQKILGNVMTEINNSVSYVIDIPYEAVGYRLASLMCLLPAYQTLLSAAEQHDKLFTPEHSVKISRSCFSKCMEDAKFMVRDNNALLDYSQKLQTLVEVAFT